MPNIKFRGQTLSCEPEENLRDVLHRHGLSPHNHITRFANCHGLGTCGTCAVEVQGEVSEPGLFERLRLLVWPLTLRSGLRLACKTKVKGDVEVTKHPGFWGHRVP
jgi:ferredoxin